MPKHHITPRSLLHHKPQEFVDHPSNKVDVTFKQHVALHKWLFMLTGEISCEYAYNMMSGQDFHATEGWNHSEDAKQKISNAGKRPCICKDKIKNGLINHWNSSNAIEHRKIVADNMNNNNPMKGKKHPQHILDKIIEQISGKNHYLFGKNMPEETKSKISKSRKGKMTRKNHHSSKLWFINGNMFFSSTEAGNKLNINRRTIESWCRKNIPHCYSHSIVRG